MHTGFCAQKSVTFSAYRLDTAPQYDSVISDGEYGNGDWISLTDARLRLERYYSLWKKPISPRFSKSIWASIASASFLFLC